MKPPAGEDCWPATRCLPDLRTLGGSISSINSENHGVRLDRCLRTFIEPPKFRRDAYSVVIQKLNAEPREILCSRNGLPVGSKQTEVKAPDTLPRLCAHA